MQLTSFRGETGLGLRWSPDGQSIVFGAQIGQDGDIYVIKANGGVPRPLTTGPAFDKWPYWSRDGQWIYFASDRNRPGGIWKVPAAGGDAVQLTRNWEDLPHESPDGKYLYYMKGDPYPDHCSVWRMPTGGGEENKVLDPIHCDAGWAITGQGIYSFGKPDKTGRADLSFYDFAAGKARNILTVERSLAGFIEVSPDGRTILYAQFDQAGSDLMLVENFR